MQEIIVTLIVLCAAVAVSRRYAPKSIKRAARIHGVRVAQAIGWRTLAARIAAQAEAGASCGDGCGSCGNCGTPAKPGANASISVEALKQTIRR